MFKQILLVFLFATLSTALIVPMAHAKRPLKGDSTVVFLDVQNVWQINNRLSESVFRVQGRASEVYIAYWKNGRHDFARKLVGNFELSFPANNVCAGVITNAYRSGKSLELWMTSDDVKVNGTNVDISVRGERIMRSCEVKN